MSDTIPISQLTSLPVDQVTNGDVFPITNADGDNITYKLTLENLDTFIKTSPSSSKSFIGTITTANFATSSITASYALTASFASGSGVYALSSSYSKTSSVSISSSYAGYANVANTVLNPLGVTSVPTSSITYFLVYNPASPNNGTASYAISSSFAVTASYSNASATSITASYSNNTTTASYALTASFASGSGVHALSSSYARSSSYASNLQLSGDVTGNSNNCTVEKLQSQPVSSAIPNDLDLLVYTSSQWQPQPVSSFSSFVKASARFSASWISGTPTSPNSGDRIALDPRVAPYNISGISQTGVGKFTITSSVVTTSSVVLLTSNYQEFIVSVSGSYSEGIRDGYIDVVSGRGSWTYSNIPFSIVII